MNCRSWFSPTARYLRGYDCRRTPARRDADRSHHRRPGHFAAIGMRAESKHLIQIAADPLVHRHVTVQGRRPRAETDYQPAQPIAFADVSQRTINDKDVAASYEGSALSTCGVVAIRRQVGDDLITNRLRGVMRDLKLSRILVVTRRAAVGFLDDALVERNFGRIGGKGIDDDLGGTIIVGRPALSLLRHGRIRASGQYKRTKDIKSDKLTPSHLVPSPLIVARSLCFPRSYRIHSYINQRIKLYLG